MNDESPADFGEALVIVLVQAQPNTKKGRSRKDFRSAGRLALNLEAT